jgi:uncharacterized protein (TIGR02453 family)
VFTGFPRDALGFFHELSVEMNRDWFLANKARYDEQWVAPMQALLEEVAAKAPVKVGAPKIMRIYRDTRFAKDKTPYKTHIAGRIPTAKGHTFLYAHFGIDEEWLGGGVYFFDAKQLAAWRRIVNGKRGEEVDKLVQKLRKAGFATGGHDDYVRMPKPFADDHPRAYLLKMKGLSSGYGEVPRGLVHKPGLVKWIVEQAKANAALTRWLDEHIPKSSDD